MKVIDFQPVCIDKHNRAFFIRVEPENLKSTLTDIINILSNLSWISRFDEEYIRESFEARTQDTIEDIHSKLMSTSCDPISSDAGEYVVSELAREAIVHKMGYLDIPLAELYNKKKSGNPGFDFHSQTPDHTIIFGEAKYLSTKNAYGTGLRQVVNFITERKDLKDIIDLRYFCSAEALTNASKGVKGFAIAFSAKETPSEQLIRNIAQNTDFEEILQYQEIIMVAVNL